MRALTFDADQTLWDFRAVYQQALDATVTAIIERGYATEAHVSAELLRSIRDDVVVEYRGRPHRLEDVRNRSFQVFFEGTGSTVSEAQRLADEMTQLYLQVRFDAIRLFPEVTAVLERLGERFPLGLLSNGNTYPERCGLPNTFSAIVLGPSYGFEKPDPRAFEEIARQLGVATTDLVHVGDADDDIEGANGVGATSVLVNRSGAVLPWAMDADYEVRDLTELESVIDDLGR